MIDTRKLASIGDEVFSINGLFLCLSSTGIFSHETDLSRNHFFIIDLEAGARYSFEVIRDTNQCALDTVAFLYEGECTVTDGDPFTITGCTEIAQNDDTVDRCGPYGDPYFEYTSATTEKYTFRVSYLTTSLSCTDTGIALYNYSAKVTVHEEPPSPCSGVTCSNAGKCEVLSHTEALCTCENTFVPSESGLECICPDGLDFHANVNRCLPPPTAKPSDLPSVLPSLTPSSIPSDGQIVDEEDTPSSCVDDMSGTFKLFNIMEEVECSWLTKNKDKTNFRKNKYCVIDEVKSLCQSTCGVCTGCDDKEGTFTLLNMKKRETCAWLTKNKLNAEKRKDAYCILDEVRDMCKASCGACAVENKSGRV